MPVKPVTTQKIALRQKCLDTLGIVGIVGSAGGFALPAAAASWENKKKKGRELFQFREK